MPLNRNDWVPTLLRWHGHDSGGVRVPFSSQGGNPLRDHQGAPVVIQTGLVLKLRHLAQQLAQGLAAPRWVFLVGGPGNGKSEAVQEFLRALDHELGCNGSLERVLQHRFNAGQIVPWHVDLRASSEPNIPPSFDQRINRLIIVQDASASDQPDVDAARRLVEYVEDLVTHPTPTPVFVCCVNRGLLARALRAAQAPEVIEILEHLIRATALGREALSEQRPDCWPVELPSGRLPGQVACWPLDMESLLLPPTAGGLPVSPVEQAILNGVEVGKWETPGACADCDDADLCPFRTNAEWLRDANTRQHLLVLLRRGELASGRRWTFRDTFSLVAELLVGQWDDFVGYQHPCDWVHAKATDTRDAQLRAANALSSTISLVRRLYPQAMFPRTLASALPRNVEQTANQQGFFRTLAANECVSGAAAGASTHIRELLLTTISDRLDPAALSPHDQAHPLGLLEDGYSQSVELGNDNWPGQIAMAPAEEILLHLLSEAEVEWDPLSRESAQVGVALRSLRVMASSLAKRTVGVRLGYHRDNDYLGAYEAAIRDESALEELSDALRSLLGDSVFQFDALESFGQPHSDTECLITLEGPSVAIDPISPAPQGDASKPAHDLPAISISNHTMPLTFDLYTALRLRQDGCASSSLPASVRASIDRIRHLYAGELCREVDSFVRSRARFDVAGHGRVTIPRRGEAPRFRSGG